MSPRSGPRTDQAGFSVESGTARYVVRDPNKLTLNQWHHIVGVREGESLRQELAALVADYFSAGMETLRYGSAP